jgi:hypothetical protein
MNKSCMFAIALFFGLASLVNAGTTDLLSNGDFASGLTSWTTVTNTSANINTTGEILNWSVNGGSNGTYAGVYQELNKDVSSFDSLILKYRISPTYQTLSAPGWAGGWEYPAIAYVSYTNNDSSGGYFATGYYYSWGGYGYDYVLPHTYVEQNQWYDYTSANLLSLNPNIKTIDRVWFYGAGWSYAGSADDVQLLATNRAVPEPSILLLIGAGLIGCLRLRSAFRK